MGFGGFLEVERRSQEVNWEKKSNVPANEVLL